MSLLNQLTARTHHRRMFSGCEINNWLQQCTTRCHIGHGKECVANAPAMRSCLNGRHRENSQMRIVNYSCTNIRHDSSLREKLKTKNSPILRTIVLIIKDFYK